MRKQTTQSRVRVLASYFDGGGLDELAHALRHERPPRRRDPVPRWRREHEVGRGGKAALADRR